MFGNKQQSDKAQDTAGNEANKLNESIDEKSNGKILANQEARSKSFFLDINSKGGKARIGLAIGLALLILLFLLVLSLGGSNKPKTISNLPSDTQNNSDQPANNNSAGYIQSPNGQFSDLTLDVNYALPQMIKSQDYETNIGQQISWQNGFAVLVASVDRDYRPASEFTYKQIAEAGDEIVRVNFVVGNATNQNMMIGYDDLALYALTDAGVKSESERFSEDVYAPRNGQILGGKQMQKISLHYRVKRGEHFNIVKNITIEQRNAVKSKGEERFPVLNLKINLP
jgi:hypothetical protein